MSALRKWVDQEWGNLQKLADAVCVTQPAVSQWVNLKKPRIIQLHYAEKIMKATGLSAKDIYPDYYELFKRNANEDYIITKHDESKIKTQKAKLIIEEIEALHKKLEELMVDS